jgi:hypothetical protein
MKALTPLIAWACVLCACRVPIAHLSAIGEPPADADAARASSEQRTGYSCRWWVLGVTFGVPRIEEAVADAISDSEGASVLRDADLVGWHPVYGLIGRHCYEITGTPWHPLRDAGEASQ